MHPDTIEEAEKLLMRAHEGLTRMENSYKIFSWTEFETGWDILLTAFSTLYEKIIFGAKNFPASQQWLGKKTAERKQDPLLKYLWHARNAEQHGLKSDLLKNWSWVTSSHPDIKITINPDGSPLVKFLKEIPVGTEFAKIHLPTAKLLPVTDRGVVYDVPTKHMGIQLTDSHPIEVAHRGLTYISHMVDEAAALSRGERYTADFSKTIWPENWRPEPDMPQLPPWVSPDKIGY